MFENFQEYCQCRRPKLCQALSEYVGNLFDESSQEDQNDLQLALNGGKAIRGVLLCMIAEILGGEWEKALPSAVAVEFIHAASLIHDDFVDQDRFRRHMPALWTLKGARKAVLLGDVLFASAIQMMSEIGRDEVYIVSRAIARISAGALMEFSGVASDFTNVERLLKSDLDLYEKIIHLKTGILFEAACELGATAATADQKTRRQCRRYGALIGEAYQIADDIEDFKECLVEGSIRSERIPFLVPTIIHFMEEDEVRFHMTSILDGSAKPFSDSLGRWLESVIQRMEEEIEHRLRQAVEEVRGALKEQPHAELGFKAPWDLVAMFNTFS